MEAEEWRGEGQVEKGRGVGKGEKEEGKRPAEAECQGHQSPIQDSFALNRTLYEGRLESHLQT